MDKIIIFELDLTGGTCGFPAKIPGIPSADQIRNELIRRNKVVKNIESTFNIEIKRNFLRNISYLENELVKNHVTKYGIKSMPIFLFNEKNIIHSGSFPDFDVLENKLKLMLAENNFSWFTIIYRIVNAIPYLIDHFEYFMSAGKSCGIRFHDKYSE